MKTSVEKRTKGFMETFPSDKRGVSFDTKLATFSPILLYHGKTGIADAISNFKSKNNIWRAAGNN